MNHRIRTSLAWLSFLPVLVLGPMSCAQKRTPTLSDTQAVQVLESRTWRLIPGTRQTPPSQQAQVVVLWKGPHAPTEFALYDQGQWMMATPYSARKKMPSPKG